MEQPGCDDGRSGCTADVIDVRGDGARRCRSRRATSRDDILKTKFTNLYDVIRALRGNRLRVRASERFSKSSAMQVYLGMRRIGAVLTSCAPCRP